jgi:O-antigen/teichoic acid export membrane protein
LMNIKLWINKRIKKIKDNSFVAKFLKNFLISFIGEGGASFLSFISTIFLISIIGNTNYGILVVAYSFVLIVDNVVNFQAWHAMISFGSDAIENDDYGALERLIKIGTVIDVSMAILGLVLALSTASFFSNLFGWNAQTTQSIYILSFMILFNFTGTSVGIIRLLDRFVLYSVFRIASEIIRLLLIVVFCLVLKMGLKGAAFAYALGYIFGYLLFFILFINELRKHTSLSIRRIIKSDIKQDWKKVFKFTFWTSLTASADIPVQQFDTIFLSMLSYDLVAVFKVYKQIGQVLTKFATPVKQAIMPLFSELVSKEKYRECYAYYKKMIAKGNMLMAPFVLILTGASVLFLHLTLDPIYVNNWLVLFVYLLLRGFALSFAPIHPLFIALGQVKQNFYISLIANSMYIAVVWLMIPFIGIWAILLGLLIEYLVVLVVKQKVIVKVINAYH